MISQRKWRCPTISVETLLHLILLITEIITDLPGLYYFYNMFMSEREWIFLGYTDFCNRFMSEREWIFLGYTDFYNRFMSEREWISVETPIPDFTSWPKVSLWFFKSIISNENLSRENVLFSIYYF